MPTITETRGQCSAPISHTPHRCSCPEFVAAGRLPRLEFNVCMRCFHTDGVHRIEARP